MSKRILLLATLMVFLLGSVGYAAVTTRIVREEERLLPSGVRITEIETSDSVTWYSIGDDEQPYIVIERTVEGIDLDAMEDYLQELRVEEDIFGSGLRLRTFKPSRPPSDGGFPYLAPGVTGARINVTVYASPELATGFHLQTLSGNIKFVGFYGELNLEASSGDIVITEFKGTLEATTSSGDIEVVGFYGELDLETSSGNIRLGSGEGEICAQTSSGRVDLQEITFSGSSCIQTSSGSIKGLVNLSPDGSYRFETRSGGVDLQMPADIQGSFDLRTRTGTVDFQLASGQGPLVSIITSTGNIVVRRAPR